jgi:HK97 family phage prohead protease
MRYKLGQRAVIDKLIEVKKADKENFTLEAVFSTQDVDRHGDTVVQSGWDLESFRKNPVILNSHNYGDASEVIGKMVDVEVVGKKLVGTIKFAVNENPKAKVIFDLYAGGFLSAFSVGFIPKGFKTAKDGTVDWTVIEESELLEVSAVSVPANARALAKQKGIEVDALGEDEPTEDEPTDEEPEPLEETTEAEPEPEVSIEDADPIVAEAIEQDEERGMEPTETRSAKLLRVVEEMNGMERQRLTKVKSIVDGLLAGSAPKETRSRKINQAVRELLRTK